MDILMMEYLYLVKNVILNVKHVLLHQIIVFYVVIKLEKIHLHVYNIYYFFSSIFINYFFIKIGSCLTGLLPNN